MDSPAPASAGSPTNPPNGSPQGYPAETGAGEPRVLAVDLALEIATVALGGVTYRLAIDDGSGQLLHIPAGEWERSAAAIGRAAEAFARLGAVPSVDTWRQWWLPWYADPGRHTIRVRATDESGQTQPADRLAPFPSGAQGWHEVVVIVR